MQMTIKKCGKCGDNDGMPCSIPGCEFANVEQAGGDERTAFNAWLNEVTYEENTDRGVFKVQRHQTLSVEDERIAWRAWQGRALLARSEQEEMERLREAYEWGYGDGQNNPNGYSDKKERDACVNELLKQPFTVQAEAERPTYECTMGVGGGDGNLFVHGDHASIKAAQKIVLERDAALARVAELEKLSRAHDPLRIGLSAMLGSFKTATNPEQEGTLRMARQLLDATADARYGDFKNKAIVDRLIAGLRTPVAQAQQLNDLDKQCRDDVARALGLRPNQERGFAWSYLLASIKSCVKASGDSAQAQHSVPEEFIGRLAEFLAQRGVTGRALLRDLRKFLAAAPGKEGV
ncbi:hypothetical protein [Pseudomonas phage Persinger]|uniref:Uncharacterized protein n=1 Tax=Pseudomonas phage Persinger TaxID=2749430 RepID=A0A7D7JFT6_9CAUD|nr:hypothetical protein KB682_gp20 [Pseudomonas phage Persinger]QMP19210.1 hypothetical protein [Pseudomonas phage Persinger]